MTSYEYDVVYNYKHAVNKSEQILILADLNDSSEKDIIDILKKAKVYDESELRTRKCNKCGRKYVSLFNRGVPICNDCKKYKRRRY